MKGPVDVALLEAVVSESLPDIAGTKTANTVVALLYKAVGVIAKADPSVLGDRCALRHILASLMRGGSAGKKS